MILDRTTETQRPFAQPVLNGERILEMTRMAREIPIAAEVRRYGIALVLGTHPDSAGKGWGRALMSAGIAAAGNLPCLLETSNPANVGFYGRSGWQVAGEIDQPVPTWILRIDPVPPLARR